LEKSGLNKVLSHNVSEDNEENHEKNVTITRVPSDIKGRTSPINVSDLYYYISLLSPVIIIIIIIIILEGTVKESSTYRACV
jgi:hypothetical protein